MIPGGRGEGGYRYQVVNFIIFRSAKVNRLRRKGRATACAQIWLFLLNQNVRRVFSRAGLEGDEA